MVLLLMPASVKRLLEADRTLGREVGSDDPAEGTFAFYSGEAPGSGVEVWFSGMRRLLSM